MPPSDRDAPEEAPSSGVSSSPPNPSSTAEALSDPFASLPLASPSSPLSPPSPEEEWSEFKTDQGESYYFERKSGHTVWERPEGVKIGKSPGAKVKSTKKKRVRVPIVNLVANRPCSSPRFSSASQADELQPFRSLGRDPKEVVVAQGSRGAPIFGCGCHAGPRRRRSSACRRRACPCPCRHRACPCPCPCPHPPGPHPHPDPRYSFPPPTPERR